MLLNIVLVWKRRRRRKRRRRNWKYICECYLHEGSLQIYPVLKSHGASFQRKPKPAHASSHRSAARNEEHLPSPDGSVGPHRSISSFTALPSTKIQEMESPVFGMENIYENMIFLRHLF